MTEQCIFCSIVGGKMPTNKVYEDTHSIAFLDINPRNPGHTLIIPKRHYETVMEMPDSEAGKFFESVRKVSEMVRKGVQANGISLAQNNGKAAGQVVPHVHFHIIPRFLTEGPVALESVLSPKKMDDESIKQIIQAIKLADKGAHSSHEPRHEAKHETRKKPEKINDEDFEKDEFEEMDMSF